MFRGTCSDELPLLITFYLFEVSRRYLRWIIPNMTSMWQNNFFVCLPSGRPYGRNFCAPYAYFYLIFWACFLKYGDIMSEAYFMAILTSKHVFMYLRALSEKFGARAKLFLGARAHVEKWWFWFLKIRFIPNFKLWYLAG